MVVHGFGSRAAAATAMTISRNMVFMSVPAGADGVNQVFEFGLGLDLLELGVGVRAAQWRAVGGWGHGAGFQEVLETITGVTSSASYFSFVLDALLNVESHSECVHDPISVYDVLLGMTPTPSAVFSFDCFLGVH